MGFIISLIIAYLLGSISTSIILSKQLKLPDPRQQGSGNPGATNMARVAGKKVGAYVLAGDALKGLIAVLIGLILQQRGMALGFVAFAAVVGHVFPVFFKFKGGKGVATAFGAMLLISFWVAIFLVITWAVVAYVSRYVSLASIVAAIAAPIYLLISGNSVYAFPIFLGTILIVWAHRNNIDRLRNKQEAKFKK